MFLDKDFVLDIVTERDGDHDAIQAWLEEHPKIPNQKALMLTFPPKSLGQKADARPQQGEVLFLADRSGSMTDKITSLRSSMHFFLKGIPKKDSTIHKLAAWALLEDLERGQSHLHLGPNKPFRGTWAEASQVRQEAEAIACKWSLVSKWTSFFLVEEPYVSSGDDPFIDAMDGIIQVNDAAGDGLLRPRGQTKLVAFIENQRDEGYASGAAGGTQLRSSSLSPWTDGLLKGPVGLAKAGSSRHHNYSPGEVIHGNIVHGSVLPASIVPANQPLRWRTRRQARPQALFQAMSQGQSVHRGHGGQSGQFTGFSHLTHPTIYQSVPPPPRCRPPVLSPGDVYDARDYVVVDKKNVEVNTLSDHPQLAMSTMSTTYSQVHSRNAVRRPTEPSGVQSAPTSSQPPFSSTDLSSFHFNSDAPLITPLRKTKGFESSSQVTTHNSNLTSANGSPRDDDANRIGLGLSPGNAKGLSVLDAPLPASFDSNGISHAARYGPWPASVPSKFGLDAPSASLGAAKDGRTSETLKLLHDSAFCSDHLSPSASTTEMNGIGGNPPARSGTSEYFGEKAKALDQDDDKSSRGVKRAYDDCSEATTLFDRHFVDLPLARIASPDEGYMSPARQRTTPTDLTSMFLGTTPATYYVQPWPGDPSDDFSEGYAPPSPILTMAYPNFVPTCPFPAPDHSDQEGSPAQEEAVGPHSMAAIDGGGSVAVFPPPTGNDNADAALERLTQYLVAGDDPTNNRLVSTYRPNSIPESKAKDSSAASANQEAIAKADSQPTPAIKPVSEREGRDVIRRLLRYQHFDGGFDWDAAPNYLGIEIINTLLYKGGRRYAPNRHRKDWVTLATLVLLERDFGASWKYIVSRSYLGKLFVEMDEKVLEGVQIPIQLEGDKGVGEEGVAESGPIRELVERAPVDDS
ncbi:hypothetical protein MFIFM68171_07248 [Madurella fahalii]|uniref:VWFA domain-containing protein n=1 Tax=Madurella fahalii TaxID=1157608 RepID=A0ABQ0GH08_9PEZI